MEKEYKLKKVDMVSSNYKIALSIMNKTIEEIILPEGVENINQYRFNNCIKLTRITIPKSVISIGFYAFRNVPATQINYLGTVAEWKKIKLDLNWRNMSDISIIQCSDGIIEY